MQTSLIILLILCIALAAQGYYFGFVRPPKTLAWLQKSTFVIMSFLLIPVLAVVLYSQSGAKKRLEEIGFRPHPAIKESIGSGNGVGKNPTWIFEVNAQRDQIMAFYRSEENTDGWSLITENDFLMIYEKENKKMTIAYRKGWKSKTLTFILNEK